MSPSHQDPDFLRSERRAKRFWVSLIILFLGMHASLMIGVAYYVSHDATVAVVPNYHATALDWDAHRLKETAAGRLGINITVNVADVVDGKGRRAISVSVLDGDQKPVPELTLTALLYHHSDANHVRSITLIHAGEGRYISLVPMPQDGLWQIELTVDGAEEPMVQTETVMVVS